MINIETGNEEKEGLNIRGTTIKDFELSRASKLFTCKERLPDTMISGLIGDGRRKAELLKKRPDAVEGPEAGFFDKKTEEFQDILKSIDKLKMNKHASQAGMDYKSDEDLTVANIEGKVTNL